MPRLSTETRNCVVDLYNYNARMRISAIKERLEEEEEGSAISGGTEYPLCT